MCSPLIVLVNYRTNLIFKLSRPSRRQITGILLKCLDNLLGSLKFVNPLAHSFLLAFGVRLKKEMWLTFRLLYAIVGICLMLYTIDYWRSGKHMDFVLRILRLALIKLHRILDWVLEVIRRFCLVNDRLVVGMRERVVWWRFKLNSFVLETWLFKFVEIFL